MSIDPAVSPDAFDPTAAPAPEDVINRGVRLGTRSLRHLGVLRCGSNARDARQYLQSESAGCLAPAR